MSTRVTDIQARIGSTFDDRGFKSASASASAFERELAKVEAAQRQMAGHEAQAYRESKMRDDARIASQQKVGRAFMASGAAIALGIGLAVKAAVDWQAAFANVEKTLPANTSSGALGTLDRQIRDLSKTIPVGAEELAGLAASASQLGVGQKDLIAFTRVAADLGQTTTLSAEDAVAGLAKLGNVIDPGKFAANIGQAGSALLALGNQGASTEAEILDMAQRIAGAGATVGATEPQVLGLANALTSVGLDAEAGGTAVSRVLVDMAQAVRSGGQELDNFGRVSGMSGQQFAAAFKGNAVGALQSFLGGLGQIKSRGGDVFGTLDKLNLSEIRVRDTLLRASGASELLSASLKTGEDAWKSSTALTDAAGARYQTAAARILIARNSLQDTAITIGGTFLPAVAAAGDKVSGLIGVFQDLPGPAKQTLAVLGGIGGVALTAGGAALVLVPKLHSLVSALDEMGPRGAKAAAGLRTMGSALAGPLGIALAIGTVALGAWIEKQAEAKAHVEALTRAIESDGGAIAKNTADAIANQLAQEGVLKAARALGLSLPEVLDATLGNAGAQSKLTTELNRQKDALSAHQIAIGADGTTADDSLGNILKVTGAIHAQDGPLRDAVQAYHDHTDALAGTAGAADGAANSMSHVAREAIDVKGQAKLAASAINDFEGALKGLFDTELGAEAAQDAVIRDLQAVEEAAKGKPGTKGGKATAEDRTNAKEAGDKAKADAIAAGKTRQEAIAAGKAAREGVLSAAKKANGGTAGQGPDPLAVRAAMRQLVQDQIEIVSGLAKRGASTDELTAKSKILAKQVYDEGIKIGLTKDQANHYAAALRDIPDVVSTAVNTPGATEALATLQALLDRIAVVNGKAVAVQITAGAGNDREGRTAAAPALLGAGALAGAGLGKVGRFALGGVEDHSAQIGYRRVWAEPETGGEAYIPLSPAKRARSLAVLGDVARRFGLDTARGQGSTVHVVRVPVQQSHSETHPVNVTVGQVVTRDLSSFTDWSATQHSFGSGRVG